MNILLINEMDGSYMHGGGSCILHVTRFRYALMHPWDESLHEETGITQREH